MTKNIQPLIYKFNCCKFLIKIVKLITDSILPHSAEIALMPTVRILQSNLLNLILYFATKTLFKNENFRFRLSFCKKFVY